MGRNLHATLPEDSYDRGPQSLAHHRLVADVRLDNRDELADALGVRGDRSRMCDAELLLQCLVAWQEAAIDRLVGEFAFAWWDGRRQRMILARDVTGMRPLHFHRGQGYVALASMPSGLHSLRDIPYAANTHFIAERLACLPWTGRETYFRDIERVEPACFVTVTRDATTSIRYWHPGRRSAAASAAEREEGLRDVVDRAVRAQLRGAGGQVATHLSSGLDSSIVTATAARLLPDGKVFAFTAVPRQGFAGRSPGRTLSNEAGLAAMTAGSYRNIEHLVIENGEESPLARLDQDFAYQQQPADNLCNAVWGRSINRAAKAKGLGVLLVASAGNMTMSYSGQQWVPELLARGEIGNAFRSLVAQRRRGDPWLNLIANATAPFLPGAIRDSARRLTGRAQGDFTAALLAPAERARIKASSPGNAAPSGRDSYATRLEALSRHDGGNFVKAMLAEYGLSVRDATADKRVIDYCLSMPPGEFIRDGQPRSLARRSFADRLPAEVLNLNHRGYQAADWYEGLGADLGKALDVIGLAAKTGGANPALDTEYLARMVDNWPSEGWHLDPVESHYRWNLLRGISAANFISKVAGTN